MSQLDQQIEYAQSPKQLATAMSNVRMMHFLDRLAVRFNEAGIDLMILKGAVLQMKIYDSPGERPMCDLDLIVRPEQMERAFVILEDYGCWRSQTLMSDDFFPQFYYEAEFTGGTVWPVVMDVHARPFRPLRYARLVPDDGLWKRAEVVTVGRGEVYVPCCEDMLLHLAVHNAIHGGKKAKWNRDIVLWLERYGDELDWDYLLDIASKWRLNWPLLKGIEAAESGGKLLISNKLRNRLRRLSTNWRDRLALAQAPADLEKPVAHVVVQAVTTPGVRYVFRYLTKAILPGRSHMLEWYGKKHLGWLFTAHFLRWTRPVFNRLHKETA